MKLRAQRNKMVKSPRSHHAIRRPPPARERREFTAGLPESGCPTLAASLYLRLGWEVQIHNRRPANQDRNTDGSRKTPAAPIHDPGAGRRLRRRSGRMSVARDDIAAAISLAHPLTLIAAVFTPWIAPRHCAAHRLLRLLSHRALLGGPDLCAARNGLRQRHHRATFAPLAPRARLLAALARRYVHHRRSWIRGSRTIAYGSS